MASTFKLVSIVQATHIAPGCVVLTCNAKTGRNLNYKKNKHGKWNTLLLAGDMWYIVL